MRRDTRTGLVLFNLHLLGGLISGLFLFILGVSGAVLAFSDEIDAFLHPSVFKVTPEVQPLPVTRLQSSVAAVLHSGDVIAVYVPSVRPDRSYWFTVIPRHHHLPRQVFVNQYTGKVLGNLSVVRFTVIMKALHNGMAFSSIALLFLVPSGLYLWWPLKRIGIKSSAGVRRLSFDLHNSIGFFSSLFIFGFVITGAYMGLERWTVPMTIAMTQSRPVWRTVASQPKTGAQTISAGLACSVAQNALPGASIVWVSIPRDPRAVYLVKMRYPEDHSDNGGSAVLIDQFAGNVLNVVSTRVNSAQRIVARNRAIHEGAIGGDTGRLLAALASLTLPLQAITGGWLWWSKRRSRGGSRAK